MDVSEGTPPPSPPGDSHDAGVERDTSSRVAQPGSGEHGQDYSFTYLLGSVLEGVEGGGSSPSSWGGTRPGRAASRP